MELPPLTGEDPPPFEWGDLFDFTVDDHLFANFDAQPQPEPAPMLAAVIPPHVPPPTVQVAASGDRVRKRDPRMVCENFLAGRVPCACPELDAKMDEEEEEEIGPGKKRVRVGRIPGVARCQVSGCGVDISELKGYHRRHRVCLGCANAGSVLIDGENKRYCQQCGKFHLLPDFDEGKRSCRRKLERHNNRRRRKPADSRGSAEKDLQGDLQREDVSSDGEAGKDNAWSSSQIAEKEDSKDGTLSNLCSALESQNIETESTMAFSQANKALDTSKQDRSPPSPDKSTYSSACPTGRISFKLYDWNPAEFPRRLRHQIFQWLASMPVELEGYIRPGCTILTAFVSMPHFMWMKLFEDPVSYIQSSVGSGGMLFGRGTALVYFNDVTFRVLRDGASVRNVKVAVRAPKIHYVYPPCFVAGKPMDLIACGSNLLQPKFRSLISFAGKYLAHDYYVAFPRGKDSDKTVDLDHQFCRIYVGQTDPSFFGPAFIEVENECGLSNFIPVLIGDENVCAEIRMIHQKYQSCLCNTKQQARPCGSRGPCEASCSRKTAFSDFMLDVAWLLKWPCVEKLHHVMTSCQIQRFNCLLSFLISNKSTSILRRILETLNNFLDEIESSNLPTGAECNMRSLMEYINRARGFLHETVHKDEVVSSLVGESVAEAENLLKSNSDGDLLSINCVGSQVVDDRDDMKYRLFLCSDCPERDEQKALLNQEVARNVEDSKLWQRTSCSQMSPKRFIISRPLIYMIAAIAVCFGVCAVVFHPQKVTKFAVSIRRCV